ncbi:MAG: M42 family peptidase [Anaerolineales bacterium]
MSEILPFLKELLSLPGLSGYETPVASHIEQVWALLADEVKRTRLGSVHAFRFGTASEPRPRLLLAAHMDAIGLMVTQVVDGFLRVTEIGGVDARILPGQAVTVHGREPLPGVVVMPPPRLLPSELRNGVVPMEHLWVDVGLTPAEVQEKVQVGDLVSFATPPLELSEETLAGHSLDNRASVAALTVCLETLRGRSLHWDAIFAATVQEEETMAGALTSAFAERPTLAIAVDVTFAKGPGANDWQTFPLGKGITLAWGPNIHPAVHRRLKEIADRTEIPYSLEYTPRHSGTDAYAMQITAEGIPTAVIGIPLRYMHTPVEMVSLKDIQRAGRLLAEFIADLDASFIEKLTSWA